MIKFFSWNITYRQLHWIVWMGIAILTFGSSLQAADFLWSAIFTVINVSCNAIIIYSNAYWLIPRLYRAGKKINYLFAVLLLLSSICAARVEFRLYAYTLFFPKEPDDSSRFQLYAAIIISCIITYFFSIIFRFALDYFKVRQEQELLKQYTAKVELDLLKAQVQPHFLFNTLNIIYYVAQRESPGTAALLAKLSNIMRYFVNDGPNKEIFLVTEINFIRDYIDPEKMRMRYPLQQKIEIDGDISRIKVSPMLIIPLIENVFKHGIDKRSKENLLALHIEQIPGSLLVKVQNRLLEPDAVQEAGSGLTNLRSRLKLLYGNRFQLTTGREENYFIAHLNIPV